jgi:hypothetical protein
MNMVNFLRTVFFLSTIITTPPYGQFNHHHHVNSHNGGTFHTNFFLKAEGSPAAGTPIVTVRTSNHANPLSGILTGSIDQVSREGLML